LNKDLAKKILEANIKVHRLESAIYDEIHDEIFNPREQKKTEEDLDILCRLILEGKPGSFVPSVLDIGCGTGNLTLKLLKRGLRVIGIDISPEMIEVLKKKVGNQRGVNERLKLFCEDVDGYLTKQKSQYHGITLSSILHHLPDYISTLKSAISLIADRGVIYITHEPLLKTGYSNGLIEDIINKIDALPMFVKLVRKRLRLPDYTYADYHTRVGLNADKIISILQDESFEIIFFKKFLSRKTRFAVFLDSLFKTPENLFKLMARKE